MRDGRNVLVLEGDEAYEIAFTVEEQAPFGIDSLAIERRSAPPNGLELTRENLAETFDRLDPHADRFRNPFASRDGSDRGFELFHSYDPPGNEAILLVNMNGVRRDLRELIDALRRLVDPEGKRG